ALVDGERLSALGVTVLRGTRALALDLNGRTVAVGPSAVSRRSGGGEVAVTERIAFENLVVATGVAPRRPATVPQAVTVRDLDDVLELRRRFTEQPRVVVIGAGVLGCELAAGAREAGLEVELLGRGPRLRLGGLGELLGDRVERLLKEHGVVVRHGVEVVTSRPAGNRGGSGVTLTLAGGDVVHAGLVIAAVGCDPVVGWMHGNGLDLADGVACDSAGQAAPGVFAVGDVAAWWDPVLGRHTRVEHQTDAIEKAQAVADLIASDVRPRPWHSYFWTELFGTRIQALGRFDPDVPLRMIAGDLADGRFVAASGPEGAVTGIVGWNMARGFRLARAELAARLVVTKGLSRS
ncbi:MAG: FAD-dependent oxidoreductase, partial [Actinoallomurus sp.]